jgi:hypothetical protein
VSWLSESCHRKIFCEFLQIFYSLQFLHKIGVNSEIEALKLNATEKYLLVGLQDGKLLILSDA